MLAVECSVSLYVDSDHKWEFVYGTCDDVENSRRCLLPIPHVVDGYASSQVSQQLCRARSSPLLLLLPFMSVGKKISFKSAMGFPRSPEVYEQALMFRGRKVITATEIRGIFRSFLKKDLFIFLSVYMSVYLHRYMYQMSAVPNEARRGNPNPRDRSYRWL